MAIGISASSYPLHRLEQVYRNLMQNYRQLSSGLRVATAADDAAGLGISQRLLALERSVNQGRRNLNDGLSAVTTAEAGLQGTSEDLVRMRELSIQAQNGTLNASDRQVIQEEFDQLAAAITRSAEAVEFNGRKLLNGDTSGSEALDLEDGTQYSADLSLEIGGHSASDLGVEGLDASAAETITAIDAAIDQVSSTRADLGAFSNRLEHGIENLRSVELGAVEARSRITDLDFATAVANQTKELIVGQAQLGLLAQANFMQSALYGVLDS
ncbi:MAG: flagellin [Planctomycetota bacterium]|jgi:flagellin